MRLESSSFDAVLNDDDGNAPDWDAELPGRPRGPEKSELSQALLKSLYDEHRDLIFRYAASRCGRGAAADVVADTFVEVMRGRSSYDPGRGRKEAWLLGIATNMIRRRRRVESRYLPTPDPAGGDHNSRVGGWDINLLDAADRLDSQAQNGQVRAAMAKLSETQRSAFFLHAVEGLTVKEVAVALGIGTSAAKLRIFRARRKLRATLRHLETEAE